MRRILKNNYVFQRLALCFVLLVVALAAIGQDMKLGSNPGVKLASALLELESSSKGFLLPRLTTAQMNAISAPAEGLMVYNTSDACVFVYRSSSWRSSCGFWSLDGNSGTSATTHFLGTTDNVPLALRVNNQKAGYIAGTGETYYGYQAGNASASGTNNTFIGYQAGSNNITGSQNTIIGSGANVAGSGYTNAMAIGYGAVVSGSNRIRLGNNSVSFIETSGSFITISDVRMKKDIVSTSIGLDFIKALRPVRYKLISNTDGVVYDGFIAQEIDSVLRKQGIEFSGLVRPNDEKGYFTVSYATFVMPLVNAVKELDAQNAAAQAEIDRLKAENAALKLAQEKNAQDIEWLKTAVQKLQQNKSN